MLWWLTALIVPVLIHLLSKQEQRVIKVGSLQLFDEAILSKARKVLPTDLILLLLRCLMIASVVVSMARPILPSLSVGVQSAVYVDPALKDHSYVRSELSGEAVYWFKEDFPPITDNPDNAVQPRYWQLAMKATQHPADSITIVSTAMVKGLNVERPRLPRNVRWVILEDETRSETIGGTFIKNAEDTLAAYQLLTDHTHRYYEKTAPVHTLKRRDTLRIVVQDSLESQARRLVDYFKLLANFAGTEMSFALNGSEEENRVQTLWLRTPDRDIHPGDIVYQPHDSFVLLSSGTSGTFILNRIPGDDDLKNDDYARQWMEILGMEPVISGTDIDVRTVAASQLIPAMQNRMTTDWKNTYSIAHYFFIFSLFILATERLVAKSREY